MPEPRAEMSEYVCTQSQKAVPATQNLERHSIARVMIHRLNLSSNLSRDVEAAQRALKADVNISTTLDVQNVPRDTMNACSECVQRAVVSSVTRRLCLCSRSLG